MRRVLSERQVGRLIPTYAGFVFTILLSFLAYASHNASGTWSLQAIIQSGPDPGQIGDRRSCTFTLVQDGTSVAGNGFCNAIGGGTVSGTSGLDGSFQLTARFDGGSVTITGFRDGDSLAGTWSDSLGFGGTFSGERTQDHPAFTPTPTPTPTPPPTPTPTPSPNQANILGHSFPEKVLTEQSIPLNITMRNVGTTVWSRDGGYSLAISVDDCVLLPATRIGIEPGITVRPNESHTFEVMMETLNSPASCHLELRMIQEFVEFFGEVLSVTVNIVEGRDALIVNHTVPGEMVIDEEREIEITLRNVGTSRWTRTANYSLALISDDCAFFPDTRLGLESEALIEPGEEVTLGIIIRAPPVAGSCRVELRMVQEFVAFFGEALVQSIEVLDPPQNRVNNWQDYD